jgi:hypothetical protein
VNTSTYVGEQRAAGIMNLVISTLLISTGVALRPATYDSSKKSSHASIGDALSGDWSLCLLAIGNTGTTVEIRLL